MQTNSINNKQLNGELTLTTNADLKMWEREHRIYRFKDEPEMKEWLHNQFPAFSEYGFTVVNGSVYITNSDGGFGTRPIGGMNYV